jgi:hypothetical protein
VGAWGVSDCALVAFKYTPFYSAWSALPGLLEKCQYFHAVISEAPPGAGTVRGAAPGHQVHPR